MKCMISLRLSIFSSLGSTLGTDFSAGTAPIPVATMVTRNASSISGSSAAPVITVASSWAYSRTMLPTSSNSPTAISRPAVMLTKIPPAPDISTSSSSGLEIAALAASSPRSGPLAVADPITARPICRITVRTSAKSTFINPGRVIRSEMPWTALCNTSLAFAKAPSSGVCGPITWSTFSFGMVIRLST